MQFLRLISFGFNLSLLLTVSLITAAQEYNYKHYEARDGLAGSSVYEMLQDRDGFVWFATEGGISRFDGTHFKNFSTPDGLPGNLIVRMFGDSRGRIWLMPFRNTICYYYQGKIHNQQNDSMLKKIDLKDFVRDVAENANGDLLLSDAQKIYHLDPNGRVRDIGRPTRGFPAVIKAEDSGQFLVRFGDKLFSTDTKNFLFLRDLPHPAAGLEHYVIRGKIACWMDLNTLCVQSSDNAKTVVKEQIGPVNTIYFLNDSILCLNTADGTYLYDVWAKKIEQRLLHGGNVSRFMVDKEGGYWLSTLNDGVFWLASPMFKRIDGLTDGGQKLGVYSIEKFNGELWAGCDRGHITKITNHKADPMALIVKGEPLGRHVVYGLAAKNTRLVAGCSNYLFVKEATGPFIPHVAAGSIKGISWKTGGELMVTSSLGLNQMLPDATQNQTLHWGRTSSLFVRNDSTWYGTREGLYLVTPEDSVVNLGKENPLVAVPIFATEGGAEGTIWVGTSSNGLVGLQNNKTKWHFGKQNGLNSEMVRAIGIDSGVVWAATDKELNKISLQSRPVVTRFTYADDLNADIVTTLLVDGNTVYAGTPGGMTWFDKRETPRASICDLKLLSVTTGSADTALKNAYLLPYKNNSIRFEFVAVSMKSAGGMVYHYRLNGLDTAWKTTTQTSLELISLPPGEYRLELFAINKFGVRSATYTARIVVKNPFWKTAWFMAIALIITALIAWLIGSQHNRVVLRKEKARRLAEQQLGELEQKALRAQMNPHFIFNCLHSIQSFILDRDTEKANKYLSRFANLIRQTLENSLQSSVSLEDEIKYLTTYLQLEQMRGESGFEYRIEVADNMSPATLSIPVMVLQPFVENAVRHGMQGVNGRTGWINIHFSRDAQDLVCRVEDNGIGRAKAQLKKNTGVPGYQSRGMQLTYERIELINANAPGEIRVDIIDKIDEGNEPCGTAVIIRFPIFTAKDNTLS